MQYPASSFAALLVKGLGWALRTETRGGPAQGVFPAAMGFHSQVPDPVLDQVAEPSFRSSAWLLGHLRFLQSGHLPVYLLYVLLTLLALFFWKVA
jgi:hypothetical protein